MRRPLLITLVGLAWACADEPPARPSAPAPEPAPVAPAPAPEPTPSRRAPDILKPAHERPWGVGLPRGCSARAAHPGWLAFQCEPGLEAIERFYRYRFPAATVKRAGNGVVFRPEAKRSGHARVQRWRGKGGRARILVFKGAWVGPDEGVSRLRARLAPGTGADAGVIDYAGDE